MAGRGQGAGSAEGTKGRGCARGSSPPPGGCVGPEAVDALRRIRPGSALPGERVFGLRTGRAISNRLAAMARAAGLGDGFSGHSPRVGMAQDLTASGAELSALMVAGRWKSERMPAHYSRAEIAGKGAVARFYGPG